jgi:aspartate/methionine/tyrosine aminotransferase
VPGNVEAFRDRRDALVDALGEAGIAAPGPRRRCTCGCRCRVACPEPFARRALMEQGVVIMPGARWARAARVSSGRR